MTLPHSHQVGEKRKWESVKAKMMGEQFVEKQTGVRKIPCTLKLFDGLQLKEREELVKSLSIKPPKRNCHC